MALLEREVEEQPVTAKKDSFIRISGDPKKAHSEPFPARQGPVRDFWSEPTSIVEPNYTDQVLQAYAWLDQLRNDHAKGLASDATLAEYEKEVERLEELEGQQVKRLLEARLLLPPGEGQRLLQDADTLLARYGERTSSTE